MNDDHRAIGNFRNEGNDESRSDSRRGVLFERWSHGANQYFEHPRRERQSRSPQRADKQHSTYDQLNAK
jgi:hypothetical protein